MVTACLLQLHMVFSTFSKWPSKCTVRCFNTHAGVVTMNGNDPKPDTISYHSFKHGSGIQSPTRIPIILCFALHAVCFSCLLLNGNNVAGLLPGISNSEEAWCMLSSEIIASAWRRRLRQSLRQTLLILCFIVSFIQTSQRKVAKLVTSSHLVVRH